MKNKYLDYSNVSLPTHLYSNLFDDLKLMPLYTEVGLVEFKKFFTAIKANVLYESQFSSYTDEDISSVMYYLNNISRSKSMDFPLNFSQSAKAVLDKALSLFIDRDSFNSFVNSWWKHKRNFYSVLSTLDGWNEKNLAVRISQKYNTSIDWYTATTIFASLVYKPWSTELRGLSFRNYSRMGFDNMVIEFIRELIIDAYRLLVLDDINIPKRDILSKDIFSAVGGDKICYKAQREVLKHLQDFPVSIQNVDGKYTNVFESKFGFNFSKFPELSYNQGVSDYISFYFKNHSRTSLPASQFLSTNFSWNTTTVSKDLINTFKSALYSYLGAHKPETTKIVVLKKLLSFFIPIFYSDFESYVSDNHDLVSKTYNDFINAIEQPAFSFKATLDWSLTHGDRVKSIRVPFKVKLRNSDNTGFEFNDYGTYNQLYAKLIECFSNTTVSDDYLISIHPMSMFFSSYGTTFTSCHNVLTYTTAALLDKYRKPDSTGNWYKGNYEAAAGGGFVVVVPSTYLPEKQWSVPSHTRFALWMSDNLDLIRMHLSYPGKPTDGEAKSEAKAIRVMIHELLAPWHGIGTGGWKSKDINADVRGFRNSFELSDGKTASDILFDKNYNQIEIERYSGYTSEPIWSYSFYNGPGSPNNYVLPVGVQIPGLNHNSVNYYGYFFGSNDVTEKPNVSRPMYVDINGQAVLLTSKDFGFARDKKAYVLNPKILNLSKHHTLLVDSLDGYSTCASCKKVFDSSYMKGDVCLDHVVTTSSNLFSALVSEPNLDVYFAYKNKDELMGFLMNLNKFDKDIRWKNSSSLLSFLPDGNFVLSLIGKTLVLKMPVIKANTKVYNVVDVAF